MKDQVTLLIPSCNKYKYLWDNHLKLEKRFQCFSQLGCPIKIVAEETTVDGTWRERMMVAVSEVTTPYVFMQQDDHYPRKSYTEFDLLSHLYFMQRGNFDKLKFSCEPKGGGNPYKPYNVTKHEDFLLGEYAIFGPKSKYKNSIEPSIWKTDYLAECLDITGAGSPWKFESGNNTPENPRIAILPGGKHGDFHWLHIVKGGQLINKEGYLNLKEQENLEKLPIE